MNSPDSQLSKIGRIGAHAMLVFLSLNGVELAYTQQELSGMLLFGVGKNAFDGFLALLVQLLIFRRIAGSASSS